MDLMLITSANSLMLSWELIGIGQVELAFPLCLIKLVRKTVALEQELYN
jgi:hypothetical protein